MRRVIAKYMYLGKSLSLSDFIVDVIPSGGLENVIFVESGLERIVDILVDFRAVHDQVSGVAKTLGDNITALRVVSLVFPVNKDLSEGFVDLMNLLSDDGRRMLHDFGQEVEELRDVSGKLFSFQSFQDDVENVSSLVLVLVVVVHFQKH
jgi:hypothetical protein